MCGRSSAAVLVVKPDDVVFAQILAALDFDHHEVNDAGVKKPVVVPGRDVGGLVGVQQGFLVTVLHDGSAADHDPVFAAVVVHLQAEAGLGFDFDALDLEAFAFAQNGVGAPGALHGAVQFVAVVALGLELAVDVLDILAVVLVGDQQGIGGVHDDQVIDAYHAHQAFGALHKTVFRLVHEGLALHAVTLGVGFCQFNNRGPRADVAPADLARHHGDSLGFFHHGIVDGVVGHLGKAVGVQAQGLACFQGLAVGLVQASLGGLKDVGAVLCHFAQHGTCGEAEHARVPVVAASGQVLAGGVEVGFFYKAFDLVAFGLDVAKAGFGAFGLDAKGDDAPLQGQVLRLGHGSGKRGLVGDQVVGWQHEQHRLIAMGALHLH